MKLSILILALFSTSAIAEELPTGKFNFDMAKAPSFGVAEAALTLHAVDWLQTKEISRDCHKAAPQIINGQWSMDREANPLLGSCPGIGKVNAYFALSGIALYTLAKTLPDGLAKNVVKYGWLTVEGGAVAHNISMGIKIKF
jgi:hypothetical protein